MNVLLGDVVETEFWADSLPVDLSKLSAFQAASGIALPVEATEVASKSGAGPTPGEDRRSSERLETRRGPWGSRSQGLHFERDLSGKLAGGDFVGHPLAIGFPNSYHQDCDGGEAPEAHLRVLGKIGYPR